MSLSGLSLRDLEYVVSVADHGSFVRAAEHCRVAQPSLSAQIRKLEAWLGITIFERTTRRVLVTAEGQRLINHARGVLHEARNLVSSVQTSDESWGGSLRLAAISTLGPYLFPKVLRELRTHYPNLSLVLGEGLTAALVEKLVDGELDAVILSLPQAEPTLATAEIFVEPFLLASPIGHPANSETGPGWEELDPQERLLLEEGHCLRDQALSVCTLVDRSNRHGTSLETLKYMVAAGEGCTLIPALAVADHDLISYRAMTNEAYSRQIGLAWRRSDPRGAESEKLAAQLSAIANELKLSATPRLAGS
ncbi:LysR substrate-binding domain-containing protein [Rhizobium sp. BK376]|uniref:LysR substrate-binding domain-containing protein n=1 Tax=Rhizobium sp. BK376 TaxID=2512149 RepID=UPI00104BB0C8|nr:LysR substrate-binding domain-containing protein [Rhizobium sp. BK376]TCR81441.1 LysR family hydrogen peroxide-inducible transcriptional activator [Rhizobium sp. BK376]